MPIYQYQCTQCGNELEVNQKMSDEPLTLCGLCGGELKKLITSTSFVLKGSGWYVTDYPSAERKKAMEVKKKSASTDKQEKTKNPAVEKKEAVKTQ